MDARTIQRLIEEGAVALSVLARECGTARGKSRSRETVTKWVTKGVKGYRLEAYHDGVRWFSSRQALARFLAALSEIEAGTLETVPVRRTATRKAEAERLAFLERHCAKR
jgi:2-C-methyl-D-erythritol 4-phosphate cytidylyltransferase